MSTPRARWGADVVPASAQLRTGAGDPYRGISRYGTVTNVLRKHFCLWLWVLAFARTTVENKTPGRFLAPAPLFLSRHEAYAALKPATALASRYSSIP